MDGFHSCGGFGNESCGRGLGTARLHRLCKTNRLQRMVRPGLQLSAGFFDVARLQREQPSVLQ